MAANGNHSIKTQDSTLRPILCELGVLTRPDGSAVLTQGM
jgi:ribonuclease PH